MQSTREQIEDEPQIAMIAMNTDGDMLDVQMCMSSGELDMLTPHGYTLNWLAQNWEMIHKMAQVSFTAYKDKLSGKTAANDTTPPTLKLVDVAGKTLQRN